MADISPLTGPVPPRVFLVLMSDSLGGAELLTLSLATSLTRYTEVIVVGRANSPYLKQARALRLQTEVLDLGPKLGKRTALSTVVRFPAMTRRLNAWMASRVHDDDCVFLQFKLEQLLWNRARSHARVVLGEHGPVPEVLGRVPTLRRRLSSAFRAADQVIAWSDPARDSVFALSGRTPIRLDAGVDVAASKRASATRSSTRSELLSGYAGCRYIASYVGRLADDKGIVHAIRALPLLPDLLLVIAGEGPARAALARLASDLNVSERVKLLGYVSDPLPIHAASDVALLLSTSPGEGRPLSVLEASAVGTPIVAPAGSSAVSVMARDAMIELIADFDPQSVANAIRLTLSKPRQVRFTRDWTSVANEFVGAVCR